MQSQWNCILYICDDIFHFICFGTVKTRILLWSHLMLYCSSVHSNHSAHHKFFHSRFYFVPHPNIYLQNFYILKKDLGDVFLFPKCLYFSFWILFGFKTLNHLKKITLTSQLFFSEPFGGWYSLAFLMVISKHMVRMLLTDIKIRGINKQKALQEQWEYSTMKMWIIICRFSLYSVLVPVSRTWNIKLNGLNRVFPKFFKEFNPHLEYLIWFLFNMHISRVLGFN